MATNVISVTTDNRNYITENYVFSLFQTAINGILERLDIEDAKSWQVARMSQPTIQGLENRTIYFDVISRRRIGTQGVIGERIADVWNNVAHWYEDWLIQISGFKSRTMEDTIETLTSADIVSMIQGVFNSAPDMQIDFFGNNLGLLGNPRIKLVKSFDVRIGDYETDSGLKEKMPNFDISIIVEQYMTRQTANVDSVEITEYRV